MRVSFPSREPAASSKVHSQGQLPWDAVFVPFGVVGHCLCVPWVPFVLCYSITERVKRYMAQSRHWINVGVSCFSHSALDRGPLLGSLAELWGSGALLLRAPHLYGGSGSRLRSGAPPHPALPAGRGSEAPLPRVFNCGFQYPEFGLGILREGGLSDLHSTLRSDLSADSVPCLAFRYGALRDTL